MDATQLAVQAQSVAQFASTTVLAYEARINEVQSTVEKLQQLIVSERQNRLKLESQLSTAQDQIGAAERRGQLLEQKNTRLEQDVDKWKTRLA